MAWLFSKRYSDGLRDKNIKVSIPVTTRVRIYKALQNYNETWTETSNTNWNSETSTLEQLPEKFKAEIGITELMSFPLEGAVPIPGDLEGFILKGVFPPHIFDMIELFYHNLNEKGEQFQRSINQIMEEGKLLWRMANGKIFPVDPICEEIVTTAFGLLHETSFSGALQEFEKAKFDLANGDYEGSITNANLSVESVCKVILCVQKIKPGELYRVLSYSGLVPNYYEGFLNAFDEHILRCVATMRNQEPGAGHGRGSSTVTVPFELAELAVNLSAVLINFLIKQHLRQPITTIKNETHLDPEDIPF